jgi:SET domain-containing protein
MPKAGRGVFAGEEIKKGEVIEVAPFIEIPQQELENIEESVLVNYVYFFGKQKERMLIALGFGSIYNHTYTPNAKYKINPKKQTIEFIAIDSIKKDQEITVNYIQGNSKNIQLWFEAA